MGAWEDLARAARRTRKRRIVELFEADPARFDGFSARCGGTLLDYSKTRIDAEIRGLLLQLLEERDVPGKRDAMFEGARINRSENRPVLHSALRNRSGQPLVVDGTDVMPGVRSTLEAMAAFAEGVRSGTIAAADGGAFTDVINIGIGGSDLGPAMATQALAPYHDGPRVQYVSNIDGAHIADTLKGLDPARTLVIVASKTFTTLETMTNAETARAWLKSALGREAGAHLTAVSSAPEKTRAFGIAPERVFSFEDWVGGRYSVWGPVGLPLMIAIGAEAFGQFLDGAYAMDCHFRETPAERNLPMLMAMVGIWHRNFCGYATRAVLPYDQRLARLPAYLQQLDMESNGKRVTAEGVPLKPGTGPVVWGEAGTNGQHAFYQLLHQGTVIVPCEFLVAADGHEADLAHHHDILVANCLAQSQALMTGRGEGRTRRMLAEAGVGGDLTMLARSRTFPGNRPSTTLIYPKLTPEILGQIIALYEHRVFVEGAVWGINSFDQWGVELGKELAVGLLGNVKSGEVPEGGDASTAGLISEVARLRRQAKGTFLGIRRADDAQIQLVLEQAPAEDDTWE